MTKFADFSEEEKQKRKDRIEIELPVLYAVNYTDYFIMLYMLAQEEIKEKFLEDIAVVQVVTVNAYFC